MAADTSKLPDILSTTGRLALFVFIVLGIPVILFLPSAGFSLPAAPPLVNRIAGTVLYGLFFAFAGTFAVVITCGVSLILRRRITGSFPDQGPKFPSTTTLIWWCWGGIVSWAMAASFAKQLLAVWTT